jgi:hypothetical protein
MSARSWVPIVRVFSKRAERWTQQHRRHLEVAIHRYLRRGHDLHRLPAIGRGRGKTYAMWNPAPVPAL